MCRPQGRRYVITRTRPTNSPRRASALRQPMKTLFCSAPLRAANRSKTPVTRNAALEGGTDEVRDAGPKAAAPFSKNSQGLRALQGAAVKGLAANDLVSRIKCKLRKETCGRLCSRPA